MLHQAGYWEERSSAGWEMAGVGKARHSRGSYSFLPLHTSTTPSQVGASHNSHQSCNRIVPKNLVIPPLQGAATCRAVSRMERTTQSFLGPVLTGLFGNS